MSDHLCQADFWLGSGICHCPFQVNVADTKRLSRHLLVAEAAELLAHVVMRRFRTTLHMYLLSSLTTLWSANSVELKRVLTILLGKLMSLRGTICSQMCLSLDGWSRLHGQDSLVVPSKPLGDRWLNLDHTQFIPSSPPTTHATLVCEGGGGRWPLKYGFGPAALFARDLVLWSATVTADF